jgi:hypothetical protein
MTAMTVRSISTGALLAALTALYGCQMTPRQAPVAVAATQPSGVEGEWVSTDGVAISRFTGGAFETVATDTGNRLANGTYRYSDGKTVAISVTSLIRQTTSSVNCAMVTASQLNCTSSSGQQFVLTRRAAA